MGLGLALSGGGFRATLFHLGVISFLRDTKQLQRVTHISAVSGGSILAAHVVLNWEKYVSEDDAAFRAAVDELLGFIRADVRGRIYRRLPGAMLRRFTIPKMSFAQVWRQSATDLLRHYYSSYLYHGASLASLKYSRKLDPDKPRPALFLLTTNLTDGSQCSFQAAGFCNEDKEQLVATETFPLSDAVAASSAFPGLFPPVLITSDVFGVPESELGHPKILLTDGGVYDNLGVRKFHRLLSNEANNIEYVLVSDASARFAWNNGAGFLEPLRTSLRASDILTKRIHDLETTMACGQKFIRINISETVDRERDSCALFPNIQKQLSSIRTDLDAFNDLEIFTLVRHGYCVTRAALRERGVTVDTNGTGPWDPLPQSKDLHLKRLQQTRNLEQVRKAVSHSSRRKLRVLSMSDRASRIQAALLVLIVLAYFFAPAIWNRLAAPRRNQALKTKIEAALPRLEKQYINELRRRGTPQDGTTSGFISLPLNVAKITVESWTTSQVVYARLKSGDLEAGEADQLANAIHNRFGFDKKTSQDWVPEEKGWYTRPGLKQFQVEPGLYTAGAIAMLLRREDLSPEPREQLLGHFRDIQDHLKKFDRYPQGIFDVFARQRTRDIHSMYSTTIALMMLLEVRRSGLQWGTANDQLDQSIRAMFQWLVTQYDRESAVHGWRGFDSPKERNDVSEGLTLQIYTTLMDVEKAMGLKVPDEFYQDMESLLLSHSLHDGPLSVGRTFIDVFPPQTKPSDCSCPLADPDPEAKTKEEHNEASIVFLWRPWAIRSARLLLQHFEQSGASAGRQLAVRQVLDRILEDGQQTLIRDQSDYTFVSAEMLTGLSPLD